jgi:transposase
MVARRAELADKPKYVQVGKERFSAPAHSLLNKIRSIGAKPVILSRRTHRIRRHDRQKYKFRNVVERFINRIKHCRRVAVCYDKLAVTF